jgi:hypothetical protein
VRRFAAVALLLVLATAGCARTVTDTPAPTASGAPCGQDIPRHPSMRDMKLSIAKQSGGNAVCAGFMQVQEDVATLRSFYVTELKRLAWKHRVKNITRPGTSIKQTSIELLGPKYAGTILLIPTGKTALINIIAGDPRNFGRCQTTNDCVYGDE